MLTNWSNLSPRQQEIAMKVSLVYFGRSVLPNVRVPMPLIVGTSGSGKSAVARCAAEAIARRHRKKHPGSEADILSVSTLSWVLKGSSRGNVTAQQVCNRLYQLAISPESLLIVILDEVDKLMHLTQHNHNASWFSGVMQEVQELVELQPSLIMGLHPENPTELDISPRLAIMETILSNTFIIAAGAFQGGFKPAKHTVGFESKLTGVLPAEVGENELFDHFCDTLMFDENDLQFFSRFRWHLLPPPVAEDLARAAKLLIRGPCESYLLPRIPEFVAKSVKTKTPYRTLESQIFAAGIEVIRSGAIGRIDDPITGQGHTPVT